MGNQSSGNQEEKKGAFKGHISGNAHVVLLGDSTLDNLVWVQSQEQTVKARLQAALPKAVITNYAVREQNTHSIPRTDILTADITQPTLHRARQSYDTHNASLTQQADGFTSKHMLKGQCPSISGEN